MNADLERRYRRLLRAYPAAYRRDHEQEILTTLGESSRLGQCWPAPREAWALVAAGVRARALAAGGGSSSGLVTDGIHIGATLLVAANVVRTLLAIVQFGVSGSDAALALAWMFAFATLVRGGRWLPVAGVGIAAAATIAAIVAANRDTLFAHPFQWLMWEPTVSTNLLPLLLVAFLATRRPLRGRSPLLLLIPILPYAILMEVIRTPFFISSTLFGMLLVVTVLALLAAPFDPRPAIAIALFLVPAITLLTAMAVENYTMWSVASWAWPVVWACAGAVLVLGGLAGSRRLARI